MSGDLLAEVSEKLRFKGLSGPRVWSLLAELRDVGIHVAIDPDDVRPVIAADQDDDLVLACAVAGRATHLVTYSSHFAVLEGRYQGIQIVDALTFVYLVRQQIDKEVR